MGYEKSSGFCGTVAGLIGPYLPVSKTAYKNLQTIYPNMQHDRQRQIVKEVWENLGRTAGELPFIGKMDRETFFSHIKIKGMEQFQTSCVNGGIFVSSHMANWEILANIAYFEGLPLTTIYRKANNPVVNDIILEMRGVAHKNTYPKGKRGAVAAAKALKNGEFLAMLIDQRLSNGIKSDFMGKPAMTSTAAAEFALKYQLPLIPVHTERRDKTKFTVVFEQPYHPKESDTVESLTQMLNDKIANAIHKNPGQWFWLHNRWKI